MKSVLSSIGKVWAFARKDVVSIIRQPKLIVTLIVGPFLILALFGIGYRATQPDLRAVLVVSEADTGLRDRLVEQIESLGEDLILELVTSDRQAAESMIRTKRVDIAIIAPENPQETVRNGEQAQFVLLHDTLDPFEKTAIELIAEATVDGANRELLASVVAAGQDETTDILPLVTAARESTAVAVMSLESGDTSQARAERAVMARRLENLRAIVGPTESLQSGLGNELEPDEAEPLSDRLARLGSQIDNLDLTERAESGYTTEIEELREVEAELEEVEIALEEFQTVEPAVLVSPLTVETEVVGATDVDLTAFYVPGVIALLLQHLAITFAALSLVRERALGAQEVFQVAPVGPGTILTGKYVGYSVGAIAIAGALSVAMVTAFAVPMTGSIAEFAFILLLLTLASLGVGFLISSLVSSDVQAVNITMIVLLLSIFFSGFFLSLDRLIPAVRAVSWLLPITHALEAMRTIMFRGGPVPPSTWMALGAGAVALFVTSWILLGRRLRES